ncbi:MAG: phosphoribosylglycinamide formyltransferase [SAR324 cluster bacterium]|nr:phosphoribosylglycinamide formyltransferase [SAR324 cluster bacterium]
MRTAVFVSGNGSNLQALIDFKKIQDPSFELVLVISNNADAYGLERAKKAGLATLAIPYKKRVNQAEFEKAAVAALKEAKVELIALAGFLKLLSDEFVAAWEGRMINIHPSLLPAYPGLHIHRRVLEDGASETGCTVIYVDNGVDTGAIIDQVSVPVLKDDTEDVLSARVLNQEHLLFPKVLNAVASGQVQLVGGKVVHSTKG